MAAVTDPILPGEAPVLLRSTIKQSVLGKLLTLFDAVQYACDNYPAILRGQAEVRAAKDNVTVQKLNEYLPDSLAQYQEVMASHNKLTQVIFGSPVFPAQSGPGFDSVDMKPDFFSGGGFSIDWAPLDFGLHKARIKVADRQLDQTKQNYAATRLDIAIASASSFLDVVEAEEQVKAAEENVKSFEQFGIVVHAQVNADLKPGADASLSDAQLANAKNMLFRSQFAYDLSVANLANAIGLGGEEISIDPEGIVSVSDLANLQQAPPLFDQVPILQASKAALLSSMAQKRVLDKEYYPVFHFLGGVQMRGAGLSNLGREQSADVHGLFPVVPNYQVAMIINWNFLDIFRLHAEKKVQQERINQQQQNYNLVLQNLKTEDVRSRARVKAAVAIAENTPLQVKAATDASNQAIARWKVGLSTVAQVAEANQLLAQSRMQDALAKVGVWRALLSVASVHGDLNPFLSEAKRIQGGH